MDPAITPQLMTEALRRRAGLGGSSSGIGAEVANAPVSGNPIAQAGMTPPETGGMQGTPSSGSISALKKSKGEAQTIVDSLMWRLKDLAKKGQ